MAIKLDAKALRTLAGPKVGRGSAIHYDSDVPGFGVRITRAGAVSLVLNYRAKGIERRMTLDSVPNGATAAEIDRLIANARRRAKELKSGAKYQGIDPMAERHADRKRATVAGLAERYVEQHLPKKRASSQAEDQAMIDNFILPAMRNKWVADVTFSDVDALHREITKTGAAVRANRVVSLLSKMFSLAIKWEMRPDNPARGVERNPEERRKRYLSDAELRRLSESLAKHSAQRSANAVKLLLLTGARRGEVLGATWSQFDLSKGTWTKPSAHTKQKKEHQVPLSGPARQVLVAMRADAENAAKKASDEVSQFLFPGRGDNETQAALKNFWKAICKEAKIKGARLHDLRHTYASILASAGQSLPVIGALLGHTNPGTTARYAHLTDDPLRQATERAAAALGSLNSSGGDVVELTKPRKRGR